MASPDLYKIDGEKMQLGEVVKRCEVIAKKDKHAFFVGRETIRGRLRCGIRTWTGLTSPVASRKRRVAAHPWRSGVGKNDPANGATRRRASDTLYEPEDYDGPDETLDELLKGY